ncbi:MAG: hypothetical protein HOP04_02110 [Methylophilaceae bacterium]|nr:hypothetical protein [Methylophilaceae bacterium]
MKNLITNLIVGNPQNWKVPASLKRYESLIEEIEDYRCQGVDGDGYWVHLKPGYINTLTEVHSVHEDNITQCLEVFRSGWVKRCECPECIKLLAESNDQANVDFESFKEWAKDNYTGSEYDSVMDELFMSGEYPIAYSEYLSSMN